MTRDDVTQTIATRKRAKKLTWREIASHVSSGSPIVATAALLGQMRLLPEEAAKAATLLDLGDDARDLLAEVPYRGSLPTTPRATRSSIVFTNSSASTARRGRRSSRKNSATAS